MRSDGDFCNWIELTNVSGDFERFYSWLCRKLVNNIDRPNKEFAGIIICDSAQTLFGSESQPVRL